MTIEERLCFIRAGYSAQDIAVFEAAEHPEGPTGPIGEKGPLGGQPEQPAQPEQTPANEPAADPPPVEEMPAWAKALKASFDEVKKTMQSDNRRFDDMGDDDSIEDAAENALAKYITGKAPEKSNNRGGRQK